eukprot:3406163-Rhodomonas_salina.1
MLRNQIPTIEMLRREKYSLAGRTGATGCEASTWTSATSIVAVASTGVQGSRSLAFTVSDFVSSFSAAFSYSLPVVRFVFALNFVSSGIVTLTISGSDFGTVLSSHGVGIGQTSSESSVWSSDSSIVAIRASPGVVGSAAFRLTLGRQIGSVSSALTYNIPMLKWARNFASPGTELHITSSSISTWALSEQGRIGGSACEQSEWFSHSSLTCRFASGVGKQHEYLVTSHSLAASLSFAMTYDTGMISSVSADFSIADARFGGFRAEISGTSFGLSLIHISEPTRPRLI